MERPSSQQLCQSLNALKGTVKYQESLKQDIIEQLKEQLRNKDLQIQAKDCNLLEKDQLLEAKDQDLQALKHEVEAKEHQLTNQQLESNEEITAPLQHTITQKDKEIAELRQLLLNKKHEKSKQLNCSRIFQATPDSVQQISMTWEIIPDAPESFDKVSAVIGEKAYFKWARFVYELNLTTRHWNRLNDHSLLNFFLVSIENDLTTVGGLKENWRGTNTDSNKLYSYIQGKWVEKYPPMPTKRYSCAAVYANHALIVAGGASIAGTSLSTVEILNSCNNHWSTVSSLPTPTLQPSVSICGECIYLHNTHVDQGSEYSVVRCSLLGRSKDIYQYNPNSDSWHVVSHMNVARSHCAAALLPDSRLIVIGGSFERHLNELATIL